MKRNLIIFGTKPEIIKMAPLAREFLNYKEDLETKVCITIQYRKILNNFRLFLI
jgi:UDP-N-acetylglucosamine 2-epimerase (non-hydrolysing)